jgi:hypothetical protein
MRVVLQGSLSHFTPSELLLLLGDHAHTGTLDVVGSDEARARIMFRDGRLVSAQASGLSGPDEVITRVVGWREGTFTFLDDVVLAEGPVAISLEVGPLVAAAEARFADSQKLLQLFPDDSIVFRVVNRPAVEGHINLSAPEFQVLFQFAAGRPLAEVRGESKLTVNEFYPIVHKLQTNGLIEVVNQAVKESAKESPPAKADAGDQNPIGTLTADNGTMHPLMDEISQIGRTDSSDIAFPDASVSSKHARILRTAEGFEIEDLGSRNGTFVNSEQVTGKRLLADGDTVRLGKVILTFNLAVKARSRQTTQTG